MRKLAPEDVLPLDAYLAVRERIRDEVRRARTLRRVRVGDRISLSFENRQTVLFQIQEMVRVEEIRDPEKIAAEVEVYNDLIADDGELRATFFVEITDRSRLKDELDSLVGLETRGLWMSIDGHPIAAEFEPGHAREDRISAVHYIRFVLGGVHRDALRRPGTDVRIAVDHPAYRAEARLAAETVAALADDLGIPAAAAG